MTRPRDETGALFNSWAETYDSDLKHSVGPLEGYEMSLSEAAGMLSLEPGARVLDVGIGTGAFAAFAAQSGAAISGVDPSPSMLDRCRAAHPEFELAVGGFTPIPHRDAGFDTVISSFALHEVPATERGLACAEVARVLKPGRGVCLLDIMFVSPEAAAEARHILGRYWDPDEDYPSVGALDAQLRRAGITGIHWRQTAPYHWAVVGRKSQ